MKTKQARVSLPGEMYRKRDRWWWKVRLPGENRLRARALRPLGASAGTTSRRVAEEVALAMWEAASVAQARVEFARARQESARARAEAHCRLHHPPDEPDVDAGGENIQPLSVNPSEIPDLTVDVDLTAGGGDLFTFANCLVDSAGREMEDQARCDCCGSADFYAEYLLPIDSGQQLCPRCQRAFQKKVQQLRQQPASKTFKI
ncbi:MAG: hypothetical protein IIA65_02140 [Planctomycetes bacterium]|nr:hypothetical protein [Planctomycetota bacterium]